MLESPTAERNSKPRPDRGLAKAVAKQADRFNAPSSSATVGMLIR